MLFEFLILHNYAFFFRECAYLCDKICGIYSIDDKYTVEKSDKERKRKIFRKPVKSAENMRVYAEIVYRAEERPKKENSGQIMPFIFPRLSE